MFVSLFVRQTQTKDFCQAFKDNGFRIDYTFCPSYQTDTNSSQIITMFVIGSDYWSLDTYRENWSLVSNESSFSDGFGSHYSMAFTVIVTKGQNSYGFLRVREIFEFNFDNNFCLIIEKRFKHWMEKTILSITQWIQRIVEFDGN